MSFYIVKGDIFEQKVDAIVIPSQPSLRLEGPIGEELKNRCGDILLLELEQLKNMAFSDCRITNAYNLPCKKLIFCATPKWRGGEHNEQQLLMQCYENSLLTAVDFGLNSIAFPLLATGAYEYPKREAIEVAIYQIEKFLKDNDIDVALVIYDESTYKSYKDIFNSYKVIGGKLHKKTEDRIKEIMKERGRFGWYTLEAEKYLDEGTKKKNFSEKLKHYLTAKGITNFQCYNGVVSKSMFYNYLNGESIPNKYTIVALGVNMWLDEHEICDLLQPIGETLRPDLDMDQIISYNLLTRWNLVVGDQIEPGLLLDKINEDLEAIHCLPLKTSKN